MTPDTDGALVRSACLTMDEIDQRDQGRGAVLHHYNFALARLLDTYDARLSEAERQRDAALAREHTLRVAIGAWHEWDEGGQCVVCRFDRPHHDEECPFAALSAFDASQEEERA